MPTGRRPRSTASTRRSSTRAGPRASGSRTTWCSAHPRFPAGGWSARRDSPSSTTAYWCRTTWRCSARRRTGGATRTSRTPPSSRSRCRITGRRCGSGICGCGGSSRPPGSVSRSGGLDALCRLLRGEELLGGRAQRVGDAAVRHERLGHAIADVVSGALGNHPAADDARVRAHAAGEVAEPEAEAGEAELGRKDPAEERLHLAEPGVLPARVPEIVRCREAGGDRLRRVHREPLVQQQLPEGGAAAGGPEVVVAAVLGDEPPQLARARG